MKKNNLLLVLVAAGLLLYSCFKVSELPTMILPGWLMALFYAGLLLGISFLFATVSKLAFKNKMPLSFFMSIMVFIFSSLCLILTYKPTYVLVVPANYSGEVRLFVTNQETSKNDLVVNDFGVGYISKKDFDNGFYPQIFKNKINVTNQVKTYYKGAPASNPGDIYYFDYLSFEIGAGNKTSNITISELVKKGAIDTAKLIKIVRD